MPVGLPPLGGPIGRSRMRISASGYVSWLRCPRGWFIGSKIGLRGPVNPRMILGIIVEDALVGLLMESPSGKHLPDRSRWTAWLDDDIDGMEDSPKPDSFEGVKDWILSKVSDAADRVIELGSEKWAETPAKNIDTNWEDVQKEEIMGMLNGGLELFFEEVEACFEANGGPFLESWQTSGDPHRVPAPRWDDSPCFPLPGKVKGFSLRKNESLPNNVQMKDHITWSEAWEIARPWMKDPRVWQPQRLYHPAGWSAGEMDLVLRWRGKTTIVDIKASDGTSKYAKGLEHQLSFYRFLWDATRTNDEIGDSAQVEALQGWYLKGPIRKDIDVMDTEYLPSFSEELHSIWQRMIAADADIQTWPDCSCGECKAISDSDNSSQVQIHGKKVLLPDRFIGLSKEDVIARMTPRSPASPLAMIQSRVNVIGKIGGKWGPLSNHFGELVNGAVLQTGGQSFAIIEEMTTGSFPKLRTAIDGDYLIRNAAPGLWRDKTRLYLDERSELVSADCIGDENNELTRLGLIQTKINVDGMVVGRGIRRGQRVDGKPWTMVSAHLWDGDRVIEMVAFGRSIVSTLSELAIGDRVLIKSAELGWRAGIPQLRVNPRISRMEVIARDWIPPAEHPSQNL